MLMMDVRCNVMLVVEVGLKSFFNSVHCLCDFVRCRTWLLTESKRLRWRMIHESSAVEFGCLKVVNPMSYLTIGLLENTSRLVDVSLNWTINSTG